MPVQWVMDNLFLKVIENMQLIMMGMGMQIYLAQLMMQQEAQLTTYTFMDGKKMAKLFTMLIQTM